MGGRAGKTNPEPNDQYHFISIYNTLFMKLSCNASQHLPLVTNDDMFQSCNCTKLGLYTLSLLLISTLYELVIDESNGSMFKSHS
jgi:hypothetical protein